VGVGGIGINLSIVLLKERIEEVSPPFQGGVAGTIDYMLSTKLISRPGWLICLSGRLISFFLNPPYLTFSIIQDSKHKSVFKA
jgi:hypothetical protein